MSDVENGEEQKQSPADAVVNDVHDVALNAVEQGINGMMRDMSRDDDGDDGSCSSSTSRSTDDSDARSDSSAISSNVSSGDEGDHDGDYNNAWYATNQGGSYDAGPLTAAGFATRSISDPALNPPLYETTGDLETIVPFMKKCGCQTLTAAFYEHVVVIRERNKFLCFPSSKSMFVIPRYLITDVQVRKIPFWVRLHLTLGSIFSLFGGIMKKATKTCIPVMNRDDPGTWEEECSSSGFSKLLLVVGILEVSLTLMALLFLLRSTAHHYFLTYSSGGKGSRLTRWNCTVHVYCNEPPDIDFLQRYVFDAILWTKSPTFLHRFTHLNTAGLMDPTRGDRKQLLTLPQRRVVNKNKTQLQQGAAITSTSSSISKRSQ